MSPSLVILVSFLFLFSSANAFNITEILEKQSDFSNFNSFLSQTGVAAQINRRKTITVLAVSNDNIQPLSDKPKRSIANILSLHVILDYYDVKKLQQLKKKTAILTTLFQSTGQAKGQQGFLNVTVMKSGDVAFGSAVPGSNLDSTLVQSVTSQPYTLSVLQVSSVIMVDGLSSAPALAPGPSSDAKSPPAPPPSDAEAPAEADAPAGKAADAPAPGKSSAVRTNVKPNAAVALVMIFLASFGFSAFW